MNRAHTSLAFLALAVCNLVLLLGLPYTPTVYAQSIEPLFSFVCSSNPSVCPNGKSRNTLIQSADGNFHGTTSTGGIGNKAAGTVFKITPGGQLAAPTSSLSTRATETGSLSCEVKDSSGKPLSAVVVFQAWGGKRTIEQTGEDGRFTFDNLARGKYQIAFCALGFFPELKNVRVKLGHQTKVRVRLRVSNDGKASGCEGIGVSTSARSE